MSTKKPNISQIRKYLNGELDARAMYRLERQAQDDPMLMDMLQGMESAGQNEHRANLETIDRMIKQRVQQNNKRVIPMWVSWPVAATLLIGLGIGGWWFTRQPQKTQIALNTTPVKPADTIKTSARPVTKPLIAVDKTKAIAKTKQLQVTKDVAMLAPEAQKDITPLPPIGNSDVKSIDTLNSSRFAGLMVKNNNNVSKQIMIRGISGQKNVTGEPANIVKPDTNVLSRMARVQVPANDRMLREVAINPADLSGAGANTRMVSGTIIDQTGLPLPGVTVKADNSQSVSTDANGTFKMSVPATAKNIDIAYVGYKRKQVPINNADNLNVQLQVDKNDLAEVVVVGYGIRKDKNAHPLLGWDNYNAYLKENTKVTGSKTGKVKLTVTVGARGQINDVVITKKLNDELDQRAIGLVKDGPAWVGAADGKPARVKLEIKFYE